jgi:hemerythrin-like domain-containing protein
MMPIGPLMVEHRWIERVISDLRRRLDQSPGRSVDPLYVDRLVDFLRSYADRCHHGKEEDILFRDLGAKRLDPAAAETMRQLTEEHRWARATTKQLVRANASLRAGDQTALDDVRRLLGELASFYPEHIRKEDKDFFRPAMTYLTRAEQDAMLEEFRGFDALLVHERYRRIAEELEGEAAPA